MPVLRKSSGAFDLPSIITGVVVVGILAAGVLAAIFGIIPFAQDRGAKQDLSSIRTAEGVAKAKDNRFMDHQQLLDVGYLQLSSTEKTKVKADAKGTCYVGIAKSGTGTLFYSTDANTDPAILEADTVTGCLTEDELAELIEDVGGIEKDGDHAVNLKLTAVSALEAKATWTPVKSATGYMVEYQVNDGDWNTKSASTTATWATLNAMPEDTINVRVTILTDANAAAPMLATVKLPDSTLKNPGFEQDLTSWTANGSSVSIGGFDGKSASMRFTSTSVTQTVAVPSDTPLLTYWSTKTIVVSVDGTDRASAASQTSGVWTQYKVDLASSAGKTVALNLRPANSVDTKLDSLAFQKTSAPDQPTGVAATSRQGTATVVWTKPGFEGGRGITSYTATAWGEDGRKHSSVETDALQRTATIEDVEVDASYTFTVTATNSVGGSEPSASFGPIQILSTAISNPGFEQDLTSWTVNSVSVSNGGFDGKAASMRFTSSSVTQTVTVPSGTPLLTYWSTKAISVSVDGVQRTSTANQTTGVWTQYKVDLASSAGKTVALNLRPTNSVATLLDSLAFQKMKAPDQPTSVAVTSRQGTATAVWTKPVFEGGRAISSYTATAWGDDGIMHSSVTTDALQRTAIIEDVEVGASYTFTVTATNSVGESEPSAGFGPIQILSTAISNPGFEQDLTGWAVIGSSVSNSGFDGKAASMYHTSDSVTQTVTVPSGTSLTYWSTKAIGVTVNGVKRVSTASQTSGVWTQYQIDLAAFADRTVTIQLGPENRGDMKLDNIAFEPAR